MVSVRAAEAHDSSLMGTCTSSKKIGTVLESFREVVRDVSPRQRWRLRYLMRRPCKKSTEAALYATVQVAMQPYLGLQPSNAALLTAQKSSSSAFVGQGG